MRNHNLRIKEAENILGRKNYEKLLSLAIVLVMLLSLFVPVMADSKAMWFTTML